MLLQRSTNLFINAYKIVLLMSEVENSFAFNQIFLHPQESQLLCQPFHFLLRISENSFKVFCLHQIFGKMIRIVVRNIGNAQMNNNSEVHSQSCYDKQNIDVDESV